MNYLRISNWAFCAQSLPQRNPAIRSSFPDLGLSDDDTSNHHVLANSHFYGKQLVCRYPSLKQVGTKELALIVHL
jgi:hypothetical protein